MKELLKEVLGLVEEWRDEGRHSTCPSCYEYSRAGIADRVHKPDCKRAALLAVARAFVAAPPSSDSVVQFVYENWKNEVGLRTVRPLELYFGTHEKHPKPQWILRALDVEKGAERHFALERVRSWVSFKA